MEWGDIYKATFTVQQSLIFDLPEGEESPPGSSKPHLDHS